MTALQNFENFCKKHMIEGVREADRVSFEETFSNLMTKALEALALGRTNNEATRKEIADYLFEKTHGMFERDEARDLSLRIIDSNRAAYKVMCSTSETIH
uniref:Uncharacterized protein n=1 Tax=Rhizobium phage IG49 TaxID=3129228 RepID=A0AAU8HYQ3_9CAUD